MWLIFQHTFILIASPEIHMIPKTPSAKKSRRAIRQQVIEEEEDDDFENEQPKKKTRYASMYL